METGNVIKLEKLWNDAIQKLEDELEQFQKFKDAYTALDETITDLPLQLKHKIMVPLNSKGFMKGELINTNEVLVLLGQNYFAKRSVHQAREIIDRRQQYLDENIDRVSQQIEQFEARGNLKSELHTDENDGVVEIKEEYYSDEEEEEYEDDYEKNTVHTSQSKAAVHTVDDDEDAERERYMMRLMELEQEEEEYNRTHPNEEEEEVPPSPVQQPPAQKKITKPSDIYEQHIQSGKQPTPMKQSPPAKHTEEFKQEPVKQTTASQPSVVPPKQATATQPQMSKPGADEKPKGFTGVVVERTIPATDQPEEQAPKKVSLFKQRMQQRQQ